MSTPGDRALARFSVLARIVGVGLLLLFLVAMPLKYLADSPTLVAVIGPIHGFLYVCYVLVTLDLAVRTRWPLPRTLLIMLAGTVPFLSFVAERRVRAWESDRPLTSPGRSAGGVVR